MAAAEIFSTITEPHTSKIISCDNTDERTHYECFHSPLPPPLRKRRTHLELAIVIVKGRCIIIPGLETPLGVSLRHAS